MKIIVFKCCLLDNSRCKQNDREVNSPNNLGGNFHAHLLLIGGFVPHDPKVTRRQTFSPANPDRTKTKIF